MKSEPFLFIHPVMQLMFIDTYYVPGTIVDAADTALNKTNGIHHIEGQEAE